MRLVPLLLLSLAACGPARDELPTTRCTGTVAGALTGAFSSCKAFEQLYRQNLDTFLLTTGYDEKALGIDYTFDASLEVKGEPRSGAGIKSCTLDVTSGGQKWNATTGGTVPVGSCTITFSEVVPFKQTGNTITYCIIRGRLTGSLQETPLMSASMPVNVTLEFDHSPAATDQDRQREICKRYAP